MQRCRKVVPSGRTYRGRGFCTSEGGGTLPKYSENWVGEGEMRSAGETPSGAEAVCLDLEAHRGVMNSESWEYWFGRGESKGETEAGQWHGT